MPREGLIGISRGIVAWLIRRRWPVLGLNLILAAVFFAAAGRLKPDNSLAVWFVDEDPALVSYRDFLETFGSDEVVAVVVRDTSASPSPVPPRVLADLEATLAGLSGVERVLGPAWASFWARQIEEPTLDGGPGVVEREMLERFRGRDGLTWMIFAWLESGPDMEARRGPVLESLRGTADSLLARNGLHPWYGGYGVVFDALNRITLEQGGLFILLSYLIIVAVAWVLTRRAIWVLAALFSVTLADGVVLGAMWMLGRPLNAITMAVPTLVLILGVSHVIHMSVHLERALSTGGRGGQGLRNALAEVSLPCLFNSLTTAGGFASLGWASMAVTRDFGLFAAMGVLAAYWFSLSGTAFLLPRVARLSPREEGRPRGMARMLAALMLACRRHRLKVLGLAALAAVLGMAGLGKLTVDTSSLDLLPSRHPVRVQNALIEKHAGEYLPLELVVTTQVREEWKKAHLRERIKEAQAQLAGRLGLERSNSPTEFPPALLRTWHRQTGTPLDGMVSGDTAIRVTVGFPATTARKGTRLADSALALVRESLQRNASSPVDVRATGYLPLYAQIIRHLLRDQVASFSLAFGVVFLLLALLLRRPRLILASIPVNVLPVMLVLGTMGWTDIWLDVATVTIAASMLGIVVDDTIHLLYGLKQQLALGLEPEAALAEVAGRSGLAILTTSLIFLCGFSVLALSSVPSLARVGGLMAVAVTCGALADLLVVPALVGLWRREKS